MADWLGKISAAASKFSDQQGGVVAGVQRGLEASTASVEKLARFQLAVAGDLLGSAAAQARLNAQPGSPGDYLDQQMALTTAAADHLSDRASELSDLVSDSVSSFSSVFDSDDK